MVTASVIAALMTIIWYPGIEQWSIKWEGILNGELTAAVKDQLPGLKVLILELGRKLRMSMLNS